MALLGWFFFKYVFIGLIGEQMASEYLAGTIILAAAPCTAMVFVWSYLCKGEPHFTLTQITLNDLIMIIAFAPIVGLLLGITQITVPWNTLLFSVLLYIIIPFLLAQCIRLSTLKWLGVHRLEKLLRAFHPISLIARVCCTTL